MDPHTGLISIGRYTSVVSRVWRISSGNDEFTRGTGVRLLSLETDATPRTVEVYNIWAMVPGHGARRLRVDIHRTYQTYHAPCLDVHLLWTSNLGLCFWKIQTSWRSSVFQNVTEKINTEKISFSIFFMNFYIDHKKIMSTISCILLNYNAT